MKSNLAVNKLTTVLPGSQGLVTWHCDQDWGGGRGLVKAVFTTKVEPTYDDLPEFRYHFPRTYLRQVEAAVGDWIVYYEPRRAGSDPSSRGGRQAYFATARVVSVQQDPMLPDHFYAFVTDFLEFDRSDLEGRR